jgi:CubicO group peptidase (beta-lactamase class C family)
VTADEFGMRKDGRPALGAMPLFALALLALVGAPAGAREPAGLHDAVRQLERESRFSGAVVVRGGDGVRFARGYGWADPRTRRRFTPDTPVDSASLAKPVTAAAVLMLARDGRLDLDSPVRSYLPNYPHSGATVRHLLAHSAGIVLPGSIIGKTNEQMIAEAGGSKLPPRFPPGSAFAYCNFCYVALASLIEAVGGQPYLGFVRRRVRLPEGVTIRPASLAEWTGRAIGYARDPAGRIEIADSYEDERFYGTANLSLSAAQLAAWGAQWWRPPLSALRPTATTPATISGQRSGLTWGNWYCAPGGRRCHYLGHHEGFHHMLYWNSERRISVAMVTNNSMDATLHQPLQRALVAFAEGRAGDARRALASEPEDLPVPAGDFALPGGEHVRIVVDGKAVKLERGGLSYEAFPVGSGVRYVPGLDLYLTGTRGGGLRWLGLYEDAVARPVAAGASAR